MTEDKKSAIHLAIISGFFGSGGSILAKLAGFYGMDNWVRKKNILIIYL